MDLPSFALEPHPQYNLRNLCSLAVGGPAEFFSAPTALSELEHAVRWAEERSLPLTVLGGGSNVVIHDRGIAGLVVNPAFVGEQLEIRETTVIVHVGAGVRWDDWVSRCVQQGWAGIECLSGIPGNVGATPIQNVGAYGQEVSHVIESVEVYDLTTQQVLRMTAKQCQFGYRTSLFKQTQNQHYIVLGVSFRLHTGPAATIRYGELSKALAEFESPSVADIRRTVLEIRRRKSMVLDASDANTRSCGSFFLNPVVGQSGLNTIAQLSGEQPPHFAQPALPSHEPSFKVPAAWLIERSGFHKGQRFGNVGISSQHTLALVCHSGATAHDLVEAARTVRDGVRERLGVTLRPEPKFLGFNMGEDGLPLPPEAFSSKLR